MGELKVELKDIRVSFIGFGNMATAMAKGLISQGMPSKNITVCANNWETLVERAKVMEVVPCRDVYEAAYYSDIVFICVKPDKVEEVLEDYLDVLEEKGVVSVAAGWDFEKYEKFFLEGTEHLSIMPNTSAQVAEAVILRETKNSLKDDNLARVNLLLESLGIVVTLEPKLMNIGMALGGCGVAYVHMFMEALSDAGVKHGLTREVAHKIVGAMVKGAGATLLDTKESPAVLKDKVCSPGGSTIRGVTSLELDGMRGAVTNAIDEVMDFVSDN